MCLYFHDIKFSEKLRNINNLYIAKKKFSKKKKLKL
jgi:hypothetical protein